MTDHYVLGGVRTPGGRYGGSLSHIRTDDLLGQAMVWACERVGVDLDRIEDIAAGCVGVAHEGMGDIALNLAPCDRLLQRNCGCMSSRCDA
jgi:acetyl-CoA acetyltransferase